MQETLQQTVFGGVLASRGQAGAVSRKSCRHCRVPLSVQKMPRWSSIRRSTVEGSGPMDLWQSILQGSKGIHMSLIIFFRSQFMAS